MGGVGGWGSGGGPLNAERRFRSGRDLSGWGGPRGGARRRSTAPSSAIGIPPHPNPPRRAPPRRDGATPARPPPTPQPPPPVPDPLEGLRGRLFSGGGGGGISFRPDTETGNPGGGGAGRGHAHLGGGAKAERAWLERSAPLLVGGDCEAGVARLRGVASGRLGAVWRGKGRGLREGAWPRGTAGESPAEIGGISPNLGDFHPKMGGGPKGGGNRGGEGLKFGISHQIWGVLTEFGDFAPKLGGFHPKLGIFP